MQVKSKKVLVTIPEPLLKRLDAAARQQSRNRSAELCVRLTDSFKRVRAEKVVHDRRSTNGNV